MRRVLVLLHRYAGLVLGCLLLISGLTGSVIVFGDAIDARLNPALVTAPPSAGQTRIDEVLANVRAAVPGQSPNVIYLPQSAGDAVEAVFQSQDLRVFADPASGEVLGQRHGNDSLVGFLIDLHVHLLSGKTGEEVLGWAGLGAIGVSLIGLVLWWPRPGRWRQAVSIKWRAAPYRVWYDVHRVSGVLALAFIVLTAGTGAALALHDKVTEPLLIRLTGKGARQPPPRSAPDGTAHVSLGSLLQRAEEIFPGARLTRITLPARADGAIAVRLRQAGEVHQFGRSFVWFDQYDGRVLRIDNALTAHRAVQIQSWLYPLHTGFYGGRITQLLQVAVGLALSLLSLSGGWLWIKRSLARARAASGAGLEKRRAAS